MFEQLNDILNQLHQPICIMALAVLACVMLGYQFDKLASKTAIIILSIMCAVGLWEYSNCGHLHNGKNLHVSEFSHYYFGGKYFEELGYTGLYYALGQAYEEETGSQITMVRNVKDKGKEMSRSEFLPEFSKTKARFTPERWQAFKADFISVNNLADHNAGWRDIILDAGFNGTPSWILGSRLFTSGALEGKIEWLTVIDPCILITSIVLLGISFGWLPTLAGLALFLFFPPGDYSTYNWTGGSLLRFSWIGWFSLGLFALRKNYYWLAGVALGFMTLDRIFPGAFAAAVFVVLGVEAQRSKEPARWRPLSQYTIGGSLAACIGLAIPTLIWPTSWFAFFADISNHTQFLFTNHFGWWRAITFYPSESEIGFTRAVPSIFADWGHSLHARLNWPLFRIPMIIMCLTLWIQAPRKFPRWQAITLMGFSLIFFNTLPAHYYLSMLLPLGVLMATRNANSLVSVCWWLIWPICAMFCQLSETVGWALVSICLFLPLLAAACCLIPYKKMTLPISAGLFAILLVSFFWALQPVSGLTPPSEWSDAIPVSYSFSSSDPAKPPLLGITRTFPDASAKLIEDQGFMFSKAFTVTINTPSQVTSANCRIIIRTDRFFAGELSIWDGLNLLQKVPVTNRGWVFDYIVFYVPHSNQYKLSWSGGDNIGLFQAWIQPESFANKP